MPDVAARVAAEMQRRRESAVAFLSVMVQAARDGESAVQDQFAARGAACGCAVETMRYLPGAVTMRHEFADPAAMDSGERAAVILRRHGQGGGRSLILFAHPDSEPVTAPHGWKHDPFAGVIDAGRLYGWGIADDLAGVACMAEAIDVVTAAGFSLSGDVTLASTPSKRHARGVGALLHGGISADAAVYLHPAESGRGMREIKAFASGQVEFTITVAGLPPPTTEPLQTAFAHQAVNPIEKMGLVIAALRALGARRATTIHHPALHDAVGRSTNLMLSHISCGDPSRLSQLPAHCVLGGALAFPPPETLGAVQAQIAQAIAEAATADPWLARHPPSIVWRSGVTGAELPATHPLYATAGAAIEAATGDRPLVNALHTGSDIRHPMVQASIPTIGLGPLGGSLTQNGLTDEWVDVEDYLRSVAVVAGRPRGPLPRRQYRSPSACIVLEPLPRRIPSTNTSTSR
jgi:acetylornithine deacetylase